MNFSFVLSQRCLPFVRMLILAIGVGILAGCASGTNFNRWGAGFSTDATAQRGTEMGGASQRVRAGDTLYSIAVAHDLDWRTLAQWNGITDPRSLRVGQLLRLTNPRAPEAPVRGALTASDARTSAKAAPAASPTAPSAKPAPLPAGNLVWQWPVQGKVISRFIDDNNLQKGLILGGAIGEPVRASAAGEVVYAGDGLPGYGNLLIIKHNAEWLTAYGYNQSLLVKEGQTVAAGQVVATMGRRDDKALDKTGSLLFQIRRYGKPVDPSPLLPPR
ncbi:MAG: peptidoglycan DD-metalloendopeptidase family protein [Halothiobacillaceae bacterium]|nr:peptidoglycan DD-metalloendopeptidase family protein [Halothiobacillaceae bacterium]HUM99729.1 peptidoglycan DD-metalloendopeptidase family protein [Halothiobacillus sp.]